MKEIPYGYCHCGCGEKATLAKQNSRNRGWTKGQPIKFINGHNRKTAPTFNHSVLVAPGVYSIMLTKGKATLVSAEDISRVIAAGKWYAYKDPSGQYWYVQRYVKLPDGKQTTEPMHRFIMGLEHSDSRKVDHEDHDGLNNQQCNLRIGTDTENQCNRHLNKHSQSGFKGVSFRKRKRKWIAKIQLHRKATHLGSFSDPVAAAKAYDEAARKYFGEFACVNFPLPGEQGCRPPKRPSTSVKEIAAAAA